VHFSGTAVDPEGGTLLVRWRFGDGALEEADATDHVYDQPGSYVARFEAFDTQGLRGQSAPIDIAVTSGGRVPPRVRAYADPSSGRPVLHVQLRAEGDPPSDLSGWNWDLGLAGQIVPGQSADAYYEATGIYQATVHAVGSQGLPASDSVEITVTEGGLPPGVVSVPAVTACVAQPYQYGASGAIGARGEPPVTFSLDSGPGGLSVDPASGTVTWTPTQDQVGAQEIVVGVSNRYGSGTQRFSVEVTCCTEEACPKPPASGCGCAVPGSSHGDLALGLLALLGGALRSRRRPSPGRP
jgi:MYXO-CTERM domain-containing protein